MGQTDGNTINKPSQSLPDAELFLDHLDLQENQSGNNPCTHQESKLERLFGKTLITARLCKSHK